MNLGRLPRGAKEWAEYWREWEQLPKPYHDVTNEMAEEYYAYMEGRRRYLSFASTVTMGQLETLRQLYDNKKYMEQFEQVQIEQEEEEEEPNAKRIQTEKKWKENQQIPNIEPKMFRKDNQTKAKSGPRNTKWTRVKRHGVLQLRLRELEKPPNFYN